MVMSNKMFLQCICMVMTSIMVASARNFYQDFDVTFGDQQARILDNGNLVTLSLDKASGSGFRSKNEYLFGRMDMQMKLVPGNSAGTVATFYLSSVGPTHDEIDFEFLGNSSGDPYTLHTNIYTRGVGLKEIEFQLWFDPTTDFHTYSIDWDPQKIIFWVDNVPIRVFKNLEAIGVAYPNKQAMRIYATLWDAEDWATRGGQVKTNWTEAPFTVSYTNFKINACIWSGQGSTCGNNSVKSPDLDFKSRNRMKWAQSKFMIYYYCNDLRRFPRPNLRPAECRRSQFAR